MPRTYIKNKGTTTFISSVPGSNCSGNDNYNKIDWNIDYDGKRADIELDINSNGTPRHLYLDLTNEDLANILNIPSFKMPLEERLMTDFPLEEIDTTIPSYLRDDVPISLSSIAPFSGLHEETSLSNADLLSSLKDDLPVSQTETPITDIDTSYLSDILPLNRASRPASVHLRQYSKPHSLKLEELIGPLHIKKEKSKTRRRTSKPKTLASLKHKIITPRPRTLRIALKPKSHAQSLKRRRQQITLI